MLVLGAGPAGLTAAYSLAGRGWPVLVAEADDQVGGLAKTVVRDGYRFDLGGHRFFTKSAEVQELWEDVLGEELLVRPRLSRIYWNGRFLDYPLRGSNVIRKLGPIELMRASLSYMGATMSPNGEEHSFEQWVSNRFGRRLFELFFRPYTEKVWGVPTSEIRAEWAAQRIRGLSFFTAGRAAFRGNQDDEIRSLIHRFHYPRLGPGQMWEAMAARIESQGGEVRVGAPVTRIEVSEGNVVAAHIGGERVECSHVISSLPLPTTVAVADPAAPQEVRDAAHGLRYRDFLTVALVLDGSDPFPDNWIYVHDPDVDVGRIQNYRAWSAAMVPDPGTTCLGLEYFCFEGDRLWSTPDVELLERAATELERLGLATQAMVRRGYVVRVPRAYPMYDAHYAQRVTTIRSWIEGVSNLQQVGRNGLHRYNNSDHSCLTGLRAAENLIDGSNHDLWAVNAESVYHEEHVDDVQPYRLATDAPATATPAA